MEKLSNSVMTKREKITIEAIEIIKNFSSGIHYSDLVRKLQKKFPDIPVNTIHGTVWNLHTLFSKEIYKPGRGIFKHTLFRDAQVTEVEHKALDERRKIQEEDFYQPFADWLVNELEECTKAVPLGGNKFKDKWGTPDVIGINRSRESDIVKSSTEVISAEIKIDAKDLITAFGQACSYNLFSHKSYLVIPKGSSEEDKAKIDALCLIFGIGLILFDSSNSKDPKYEIRVRPVKKEPDMFYVNKYMEFIEDKLFV